MPRFALAFLLACLSLPAWATDCPQHYAGGKPPAITKASLQPRTQELCFSAYAVMHSGVSRTPLWSAEHLKRANVEAARELVRRNTFHAEPRLPRSERAELSDYARSGYDRGHLQHPVQSILHRLVAHDVVRVDVLDASTHVPERQAA